jgi:hypothetical protein
LERIGLDMKRYTLLLGILLVVALADSAALASIVLPGQSGPGGFQGCLPQSLDADRMSIECSSEGLPANHSHKAPFVDKHGFRADDGSSAGAPSTSSQSGPSPVALWNEAVPLPECLLVKRLPDDISLSLPTGPPFELLRPA